AESMNAQVLTTRMSASSASEVISMPRSNTLPSIISASTRFFAQPTLIFPRLSILCDLDGIRIQNANRDMFAAEFYRTICWRDPAFEGGTAAFVAHSDLNLVPLKG